MLRMHRGKPSASDGERSNKSSFTRDKSSGRHSRRHEPVKISISCPSSENLPSPTASMNSSSGLHLIALNSRDNLFRDTSSGNVTSSVMSRDAMPNQSARKKMGKRNIKMQVKKFRTETKAAKTLGIIVGGFIFCWLPFFTVYLIRAFCDNCIERLLFSILFWLGYCNSALNPLIYALFSNDFRVAFKQIIFCTKQTDKSIRVLIESTAANIPFLSRAKLSSDRLAAAETEATSGSTPHNTSYQSCHLHQLSNNEYGTSTASSATR